VLELVAEACVVTRCSTRAGDPARSVGAFPEAEVEALSRGNAHNVFGLVSEADEASVDEQ
jgi:hypothetical protein